jgi:hypothetical protein
MVSLNPGALVGITERWGGLRRDGSAIKIFELSVQCGCIGGVWIRCWGCVALFCSRWMVMGDDGRWGGCASNQNAHTIKTSGSLDRKGTILPQEVEPFRPSIVLQGLAF